MQRGFREDSERVDCIILSISALPIFSLFSLCPSLFPLYPLPAPLSPLSVPLCSPLFLSVPLCSSLSSPCPSLPLSVPSLFLSVLSLPLSLLFPLCSPQKTTFLISCPNTTLHSTNQIYRYAPRYATNFA